jgi:hypothetical protein
VGPRGEGELFDKTETKQVDTAIKLLTFMAYPMSAVRGEMGTTKMPRGLAWDGPWNLQETGFFRQIFPFRCASLVTYGAGKVAEGGAFPQQACCKGPGNFATAERQFLLLVS